MMLNGAGSDRGRGHGGRRDGCGRWLVGLGIVCSTGDAPAPAKTPRERAERQEGFVVFYLSLPGW